MKPGLNTLLRSPLIWRGDAVASTVESIPTGFAALDEALPGGGWPEGMLCELILEGTGIGELRLLAPALAQLTAADEWVALISPPCLPYAPALTGLGIDLARLLIIEALADEGWWAAEQVLRAGSCAAALFWPSKVDERRLRRLQHAAQASRCWGTVFLDAEQALPVSPAPLRLKLAATEDCSWLKLQILKRRGSTIDTPLFLDIGTPSLARGPLLKTATVHSNTPSARPLPARGSPDYRKHYPVGGNGRNIWDRVIAHADELRRTTIPTR